MRRSISLSPIRTESGANLRTANWTKLKFRGPGQNRGYQHYNNRGGYNHYNNRFHNRGRGYNRGQNWRRNRYVPVKRDYNSRDFSRSRSRSYSRSRSRDRSHSHDRSPSYDRSSYSRSRSSSRGRKNSPLKSRSRSGERKNSEKDRFDQKKKNVIKSEAASYFSSQISGDEVPDKSTGTSMKSDPKSEMEMSFKIHNPESSLMPSNKEMENTGRGKYFDGEEMQKKMTKSALESVERHEKSLRKMMKVEERDESESSNEEVVVEKKSKKKKKKSKTKKNTKEKSHKTKVIEITDSDEDSRSCHEKLVSESLKISAMKSKNSGKKNPPSSLTGDEKIIPPTQPQQLVPGFAYPSGNMSQGIPSQPVMMMAPPSVEMPMVNPYGQPMNVIQMPGPDGQMIQFVQIPSFPQQASHALPQPVIVASPVQPTPQAISSPTTKPGNAPVQVSRNVPQPVPPPTSQSLPSHLKVVPISDSNDTPKADESLTLKSSKDFSEKQARRKEVIRTRFLPKPATSKWDDYEADAIDGIEKANEWPLKTKSDNNSGLIPGFDYPNILDESGDKMILGLSPDILGEKNKERKTSKKVEGGKHIPTLAGRNHRSSLDAKQDPNIAERGSNISATDQVNHVQGSSVLNKTTAMQTVAYPHITQGFTPVFSSMQSTPIPMQQNRVVDDGKQKQWNSAADEFLSRTDRSQKVSSDEGSDSNDDVIKSKYRNIKQKSKPSMSKDKMDESEEEGKKHKKKKNKKERKESFASDEPMSPVVKDKKRKKKKKNKDKDTENLSEPETKRVKKSTRESLKDSDDITDEKKKLDDGLERGIPQDLPLSHIRALVLRRPKEGSESVFADIDFGKIENRKSSKDTYEDQFVSLFQEDSDSASSESALTMSRKSLKKIKVKPQGTRSVTHMTKLTLCERINKYLEETEEVKKIIPQKVSVNLASLSKVDMKYEEALPRSPSRSRSRSRSKSRSLDNRRSRSASSYSRSRSRSRSRSLPKAYSMKTKRSRSRDDDRRMYGSNRGGFYNQRFQNNQRYQRRGWVNYRARGNFQHNRGYNRGFYHNRGRGYYNNNNNPNYNRNQWRYNRERRESDTRDQSWERRSRSHDRDSSYSSDNSDRSDNQKKDRSSNKKEQEEKNIDDARHQIESKKELKKERKKSPDLWTHDKYQEQEEEGTNEQ
ncbi:uncharacterized protein LOC143468779 isoform X2 [Clavelina lepadiformis]|uniref:uncharacterized protein LOC143468779 isoform X2 n=1 Tax=Clavelina lepadiformis TaxID=159417 RepID=UPI0040427D57